MLWVNIMSKYKNYKRSSVLLYTSLFLISTVSILFISINILNKSNASEIIEKNKLNNNFNIETPLQSNNSTTVKKISYSINEEEENIINKPELKDKEVAKDLLTITLNPPANYKRIKSYQDCDSRPEGSSCIKFGDNFTLLVYEKTNGYKELNEVNGYTTVKVYGNNQNYYHILNTELVKYEDNVQGDQQKEVKIDIYKDYKLIDKGTYLSAFPGLSQMPDFIPEPYEALETTNTDNLYYSYFMIGNDIDNIISVASRINGNQELLYIDKNNNQKFDDGQPVAIYNDQMICGIKLPLKITGTRNIKGEYSICLQKNKDKISYFPSAYYYKDLNIDGEQYKSIVVEQIQYDELADGLYHNSGIWIDINQNGRLEQNEHFSDGDVLPLENDNTYKISLLYP